MLSLIFEMVSAHTAGLSFSADQTSWTHLDCSCGSRSSAYIDLNPPVFLVQIEIRFDLIKHGRLHLEEPALRDTLIRPHDVDDEPFLVLARAHRRMPLLDLLTNSGPVHFTVLQVAEYDLEH